MQVLKNVYSEYLKNTFYSPSSSILNLIYTSMVDLRHLFLQHSIGFLFPCYSLLFCSILPNYTHVVPWCSLIFQCPLRSLLSSFVTNPNSTGKPILFQFPAGRDLPSQDVLAIITLRPSPALIEYGTTSQNLNISILNRALIRWTALADTTT